MGGTSGAMGAIKNRFFKRDASSTPVTSPMQPMTGEVAAKGLGAAPSASKQPLGGFDPTAPRTFLPGINVNRPMDYRGQLGDLKSFTKRLQRRATRKLTR